MVQTEARVYYKFDESEVREFHMPTYGELYPELYTFKYPKEEKLKVEAYIYDNNTGINHGVAVPGAHYIPRFFDQ